MGNCIDHGRAGFGGGYAQKKVKGRMQLLHRLTYCQHNNVTIESIKGLVVRHSCDNPRCVNPEHLLIGTHQDNTNDMLSRGRGRWVAGHGGGGLSGEDSSRAKLTEEQVLWIRTVYIARHPEFGGSALAEKFNISHGAISQIINGRTWNVLTTRSKK